MNSITAVGSVYYEAQESQTKGGFKQVDFSIRCERGGNFGYDIISVKCFGKMADEALTLQKNELVCVVGKAEAYASENKKTGNFEGRLKIIASTVNKVALPDSSSVGSSGYPKSESQPKSQASFQNTSFGDFGSEDEEDDLPPF